MDMDELNRNEFERMADGLRQRVRQEHERVEEEARYIDWLGQCLEAGQALMDENRRLQADIAAQEQQLADEKRQRAELEMKLAETSKLVSGMAKKSPEEGVLKALRTYANTSKRKTADKRTYAKTAIMEIVIANGLTLPEDLAAIIDSLDDEQPEPKGINVLGDMVMEKHVGKEVNGVAHGATGFNINKEK